METNPAPADTPQLSNEQPDEGTEIVIQEEKRRILCNRRKNMLNKPKYKSKRLPQTTTDCRKRIAPITQILKEIYQRSFFSFNEFNDLRNLLTDELVMEISSKKIPENSVYSVNLITFACTLHLISPKAYKYVRKMFQTCLPHSRIVKKWYLSKNGQPGFTQEAFQAVKHKVVNANHKIVFNLAMDEIILKQQVEFVGEEHHGYVQICGMSEQGDFLPEAREVLLFSLTAINKDDTIPIGYFLVKNANGSQRATLIKTCLELLEDTGAEVSSLSFDPSTPNLTMAKELGCKFEADDIKTNFEHPISKRRIHIFLYPCRLTMLLRHCFQENVVFLDDMNRPINFAHLCYLDYIGKGKFNLAHMFKIDHIFFNKQSMQSCSTSHIFNDSVADLLYWCSQIIKKNFNGVEGTVIFLKIINDLFDVLTSRNVAQLAYKRPLCPSNKEQVFSFLDTAKSYLLTLRVSDGRKAVNILGTSGFIGFLVNIISTKALYNQLVEEEKILQFLPVNKVTQFHNEHLFGQLCDQSEEISARQFKEMYKIFVTQTELGKSEIDNFITFERISVFTRRPVIKDMNMTTKMTYYEHTKQELNKIIIMNENEVDFFIEDLSDIDFAVAGIIFIAGFVVHALLRKMRCRMCISALICNNLKDRWRYSRIKIKDPTRHFYVSDDVIDICRKMENVIKTRRPLSKANLADEYFNNIILTEALSQFIGVKIFKDLEFHQYDQSPIHNHIVLLIKAILEKYLDYRFRLMLSAQRSDPL